MTRPGAPHLARAAAAVALTAAIGVSGAVVAAPAQAAPRPGSLLGGLTSGSFAVPGALTSAPTAAPTTSTAPAAPGLDPADKGSLHNIAEVVGAHDLYRLGITGRGVGVALIDTGVSPVPGLTSGNVVDGPDLSFDSQNPEMAHLDAFGHGTHLASIIAGRDVPGSPSSYLDPTRFNGIAPDATLVDVKVGASDGAVDVTQVIAGIDWVVEHGQDNGMNIRVINLSYGTDSVQDTAVDPLAFAVENAWNHGIVVVVAGGNEGESTRTLAQPARDPFVIAVGAMDSKGTRTRTDDTVPDWSTKGDDTRAVDVVAPGVSVMAARVPNGYADTRYPSSRVGDRFAKASGTSQAAAVVSGEAALLLQRNPQLTPDQVRALLTQSASGLTGVSALLRGSGTTDLGAMLQLPVPSLNQVLASTAPRARATGTGSLEASRGSAHVFDGQSELTGEVDVQGQPWDAAAWATASGNGTVWDGGRWRGTTWTGDTWQNGAWPTATWPLTWSGTAWTSSDWSARSWRDGSWTARSWRDNGWSARSWRSVGFSTAGWQ